MREWQMADLVFGAVVGRDVITINRLTNLESRMEVA
jgi:hypothetical protein